MEGNQERIAGSGETALWRETMKEESVFGGILLIAAIGLGLSILIEFYRLYTYIYVLAQQATPDAPRWLRGGSADHPIQGIFVYAIALGIDIGLFWLFVRRKRFYRTARIGLLSFGLVYGLFTLLAPDKFTHGAVIHRSTPATVGSMFAMAIWLAYYLNSKRVKRVFVR